MWGSDSSATQDAENSATSSATNASTTNQNADQSQTAHSDGKAGCGGSGHTQDLVQSADTRQDAGSTAIAGQTNVNANVPVTSIVIVHHVSAPAPHADDGDHGMKPAPKAKEEPKAKKGKRQARHRKHGKGKRVGTVRPQTAALR